MNLAILIIGLCVCVLSTFVFLKIRTAKGGVGGVLSKTFASFCFVLLGLTLSAAKSSVAYYDSFAITFLIVGLVCGLIGDVLLDLKVIYPFHNEQYLKGGMTAFLVGHLFNVVAILLFANSEVDVFSSHLLPIGIIVLGCFALTFIIWLLSKTVLKLDYGKNSWLVNVYTFVLVLTTSLCAYFAFVLTTIPMYILAIGFVFFLASDLVLSKQYFGGKQDDKTLIVVNHTFYYVAQIIIASFIFFV